jgi:hypothetical protein
MKLTLAAVVVAVLNAGVQAQERIALPRGPAPDQTIHVRVTQDMTMNVDPGAAGNATVPPLAMGVHTAVAETLRVGALDDRKRFQSVMTIDDVTMEMTMNGAPMPMAGAPPLSRGQQFTVQYDENRAVSGITGDAGPATEVIRQLITGIAQQMPSGSIAVGETVKVPMNLPFPALPSGAATDISGEMAMTLKSISTEGGARLAHFDSTFSAKVGMQGAPGSPLNIDLRVNGAGTMTVDVDRGITRDGAQEGTIDGTLVAGSFGALKLSGTLKQSTKSQ